MKTSAALVGLAASAVSAHYTLPALIANGAVQGDWQHVRQWTGYYTNDPVTDVTSQDIRCNVSPTNAPATLSIAAGSMLGMTVAPDVYHPGPVMAYMAKVPSGSTAATWDGSGQVWFKVMQSGPTFGGQSLGWSYTDTAASKINFTIPASTPSGQYLVRIEQIGLHVAQSENGAQFYLSCGQIEVTGGGSGTPSPLVAFPGAYSPTDPGLLIDIYYPVPTSYAMPGPAVWKG